MRKGKAPFQINITEEFEKDRLKLPKEKQRQLIKALGYLKENPSHPSLQFKKIRGEREEIWEFRFSRSYRVVCSMEGNTITLLAAGPHKLVE